MKKMNLYVFLSLTMGMLSFSLEADSNAKNLLPNSGQSASSNKGVSHEDDDWDDEEDDDDDWDEDDDYDDDWDDEEEDEDDTFYNLLKKDQSPKADSLGVPSPNTQK